jgi:geranylgeranyl reductase family protein
MDSCNIAIIGGGPAGSTFAWKLKDSGLDIIMLDKDKFPREKVCGGWITPAVFDELELDPSVYEKGHELQPILGFRISRMGDAAIEIHYDQPVSYGIRRCEFDQYLIERSGVWLQDGEGLSSLDRGDGGWIVNGGLKANLVIGAGGHRCPVADYLGAQPGREPIVAAQETEFLMDKVQQEQCAVLGALPELYFCPDMKGYGWCFRKGDYLNIGLGRRDRSQLPTHVAEFVDFLKRNRRIPLDTPTSLQGHSYLLYGHSRRKLVDDGALLIGDAAGLARRHSGEGIRRAIESGLMAAQTVQEARGNYSLDKLEGYQRRVAARFDKADGDWVGNISRLVPRSLRSLLARRLLPLRWFSQHIILDKWFLHFNEPALFIP